MNLYKIKITLIGAGNLATHLAVALHAKGIKISEVYSRNLKNAETLSKKINASLVTDILNFSDSKADLFIIAVPDDCISKVMVESVFPDKSFVVHTSGSMPLSIIEKEGCETGVFYPLQTFSKGKEVDFSQVPICIEANSPMLSRLLKILAETIGQKAYEISSDDRKYLHLAAIFACNFTNYLLSQSEEILAEKSLPLEILKPLIKETLQKAVEIGPKNAQTGPAQRGDKQVILKHLELLEGKPIQKEIYEIFTKNIMKKAL